MRRYFLRSIVENVGCRCYSHSTASKLKSFPSPSSHSAPTSSALPTQPYTFPRRTYGQALAQTHPHLIDKNHLTPGIPFREYEDRRKKLLDMVPEGSILVSCGGKVQYMSQSIFYKFRQATDFWYLTGWQEPDSAVIFEKNSRMKRGYNMIMFVPPNDPHMEKWDGARTGVQGALDIFGADEAYSISTFSSHLANYLTSHHHNAPVYIDTPSHTQLKTVQSILAPTLPSPFNIFAKASSTHDVDKVLSSLLSSSSSSKTRPVYGLKELVEKLRVIKSENEVKLLRRAAEIGAEGHVQAMRKAAPGMIENQIAVEFDYTTMSLGAQRPAYVPVVASGEAALTIHYTTNDAIMQPGSLVLLDAGCEYNGYASDITRTFPVSGKFTDAQRDLYEAVLSTERECIKLCSSQQGLTLNELHRRSCILLARELKQLGFDLDGGVLERLLYPHYIGHPVGIDLHDTPSWGRQIPIKEGMVITIEPGVYVPADSKFPVHFHNIGVRVEDMVYVGKEDPIVLSVDAPKEVDDVEACCEHTLS